MKRKLISVLVVLLLIFNLITVLPVQATGERVNIKITPDKTEVKAGDIVTYTVTFEMPEPCYTLQISLDFPEGLTYVENSGKVDSNLRTELGDMDEVGLVVEFAEMSKSFLIGGSTPFELNGEVVIGTFQCIVDSNAEGSYTMGLSHVQVADENAISVPEEDRNIVITPIKVIVSVEEISLNKTETTINAGETEKLLATIKPDNATNQKINWNSSEPSVATVEEGIVSAIKPGKTIITATTEDGDYEAICTVTVVCPHTNRTTHKAEASTCMTQGHGEYVTCDDCGEIISGSDEKLPLSDHQYGELIQEVSPIHTETELVDGVKAHYECAVCHKLFDENKEEVASEDLVIKATHQYGDWTADTEEHWKECGCGNIIDLEEHKGGEATCTEKAMCEVCGVEYGELDSNNHVNTEVRNETEPTCTKEGYTGDVYCKDCGKLVTKGEIIEPLGHKGGEATCTKKAVCEVCGEEYGELDPDNHANTEIRNAIEPTTEKEGYTGDLYCTDCEKLLEEGTLIPALEEPEKPAIDDTEKEESSEIEKPTDSESQKDNEEKQEETTDPTRPQTDDISNITLWVSLLVISGICFVIIAKCKTKAKRIAKH